MCKGKSILATLLIRQFTSMKEQRDLEEELGWNEIGATII